jgi:virulence factor Mce-like protein
MSRSRRTSFVGRLIDSPFWNGLITIGLIAFAVYVSYTANNGIPFVPKYKLEVDVPNASQLVRHAEVRVGGARVGQVLELKAIGRTDKEPSHARLKIAINKDLEPLPIDTTSELRVASPLGGKYLSLVPGKSKKALGDGNVLPLDQAKTAVDIDEAFRVFSPRVQKDLQSTIYELGDGVAGRGVQFNHSIAQLADISPRLQRVLALLASPQTDLEGFLSGAAAAVTTLAPLTDDFIGLMGSGATTFGAINAADPALGQTLDAAPSAVAQTTTTLTHLRPALRSAAAITRELRPAARILPATIKRLDTTLRAATPVARNARELAPAMTSTFGAVNRFAASRDATNAIKALGAEDLPTTGASLLVGLGALFKTVSGAQFNCNAFGIYLRNLSSAASEGDAAGGWARVTPIFDLTSGLSRHDATPDPNLHYNPYPNANAQECEGGNEPYAPGQMIGNVPGNQSKAHDVTRPPAAATARARAAGLLTRAPR